MVFYFAINLLCAYVSCIHLRDYPSDPLLAQKSNGTTTIGFSNHSNQLDSKDFGSNELIVRIKHGGLLEGYIMKTIRQRSIVAFEGIPFGETTGGPNRFQPAIPKAPWVGIRGAKAVGNYCAQWHLFFLHTVGNEDCLFLNVYTPKLPVKDEDNPNLPVIVFIHGGSYFFGSGAEYGPAYLLEHDVILVTINYRVGVLGFLSTGDSVVPGNNGLKDQVLALKWVHENIEYFGGDPKRVTIMGQSSGGSCVHFHMISNMSREYFSAGISLSGTAFNTWSIANPKYVNHVNEKISRLTGCSNTRNSQFFVNCLRSINPYTLASQYSQIFTLPAFPAAIFAAVIEEDIPGAFLTKHPDQAYIDGEVAKVPWINSNTREEGDFIMLVIRGLNLERIYSRVWARAAPVFLNLEFASDNTTDVRIRIEDFYFKTRDVPHIKDFSALSDVLTDRFFAYAGHKSSQAHSTVAPTYSSLISYPGQHGLTEFAGLIKEEFGTAHAIPVITKDGQDSTGHIEDLTYIFNVSKYLHGYKTTDPEFGIIKLVTSLITNFAKNREPLLTVENGTNIKIWEPVTDPENIYTLLISEEVKMIPEQNKERLKFWESVPLNDINPWIRIN